MPRRPPGPGGPCSSRSARRRGAAAWLPGTADTCPTGPASARRAVRRLAVRVFECRRFGFGMLQFSFCRSSRPLRAASRGSSHVGAQSHAVCSSSCRTRGTAPCSPHGTAASSAAPAGTARASGRRGPARPRCRTRSSGRLRRSRVRSSPALLGLRHVAQLERASTGISNGSRQRPHSSSQPRLDAPGDPEGVAPAFSTSIDSRPAPRRDNPGPAGRRRPARTCARRAPAPHEPA